MLKTRILALFVLVVGFGLAYMIYASETSLHPNKTLIGEKVFARPFKLGLDLSGGIQLVYQADVSSIPPTEVKTAMDSLRDVVERRVNIFGVSEPIVQVEEKGNTQNPDERLLVELPGVTDVSAAVNMIKETPMLEFMTPLPADQMAAYQKAAQEYQTAVATGKKPTLTPILLKGPYDQTGLTGRFLQKTTLEFNQTTGKPYIVLTFNDAGTKLFADITTKNVGKPVAIFLDRQLGNTTPITEPVVQEPITSGTAQITGNFTPQEARTLVGRLNSGALPVDRLTLLSTQTISAPLGARALHAGVVAGVWGLVAVMAFLILWYRLPGVVASIALLIYTALMLTLFKLIPVTLTAAGIAGFILSIGMAVDANILVFERTKEELRRGRSVHDAVHEGFERAWLSIRDSNISSMITAVILFWFGTSLIKGFALTFGLGVLVSMLSALTITRTLLYALGIKRGSSATLFFFGSGVSGAPVASKQSS
ncbi:MAG: protein translocase subunit SecD [Minisyncoccota bacterium]